jgi:uncharacterized membrane protein
MAQNPASSMRVTYSVARWLGITALAILGLRFLAVSLAQYIHFDPVHYYYFWRIRWWLAAHLGFGAIALVVGPIQFIPQIRQKAPQIHRWLGRIYLIAILFGTIAATYMGLVITETRALGQSLLFLAVAWATTARVGWVAALRRQFNLHREWMIRSYVVTFAFVLFRLLGGLGAFAWLSDDASMVMNSWLAWAIPLLITQVVFDAKKMSSGKRILPAKAE